MLFRVGVIMGKKERSTPPRVPHRRIIKAMVMPETGRVLSDFKKVGNILDAIGGKYLNMRYKQFQLKHTETNMHSCAF